jgi:hypothetical protein
MALLTAVPISGKVDPVAKVFRDLDDDMGNSVVAAFDNFDVYPAHGGARDQADAARAEMDEVLAHWPRLQPDESLLRSLALVWSFRFDPEVCPHLSEGPRPVIVIGPADLALCTACAGEALGGITELEETAAMMHPGHCDLCQGRADAAAVVLRNFRLERYAFVVQCCAKCASKVDGAIVSCG